MGKRYGYCEIFRSCMWHFAFPVQHQSISVGFSNLAELCLKYYTLQVPSVTHAVRIFTIHSK